MDKRKDCLWYKIDFIGIYCINDRQRGFRLDCDHTFTQTDSLSKEIFKEDNKLPASFFILDGLKW